MNKIKILPDILSNKIAAGEVVERPASVVKELCENSIDAKSSRIIIEIEKGGKSLIRISDNGTGMSREDAALAIERYATSKIYDDSDLFSISTLGFRGEALPSIASVSKFTLITREKDKDTGTKITIEGGKIKEIADIGAPVGTMIEVKDIFFNTPARQKFLKTTDTETGNIADIISSIALGWHNISFLMINNQKEVKNLPAASNPFERVTGILGNQIKDELYEMRFEKSNITVSGWAASPDHYRSSSRGIYAFVNGRFVKDKKINYALFDGFRGRLMKGKFPVAVIFIKTLFDEVDVNVHPTKHEVRFAREKEVMNAISNAVISALKSGEKRSLTSSSYLNESKRDSILSEPKEDFIPQDSPHKTSSRRPSFDYAPSSDYTPLYIKEEKEEKYHNIADDLIEKEDMPEPLLIQPPITTQKKIIEASNKLSDLNIIGQVLKTYIVCESDKDIILIDQHAAHERVLFEKLKKNTEASMQPSQRLLIPEVVETGYAEADIIKKHIPDLLKLGLEIEPFGGNTFAIKTIPTLFENIQAAPIVVEIAEKLLEGGKNIDNAFDTCLITMACHEAIRANHDLSEKEMKALLIQLDECDIPSRCPHGRPTWICWTQKEIEKLFKRIL